MDHEQSESGSPIHRHNAPENREWTPPDMSGSSIEAIERHIEQHIGKVASVFHELISDIVHIDVHIVPPSDARPYYTLVTSGMSDLPMGTPEEFKDCRFAELMLCLPASWPMDEASLNDEARYWPIRWLKVLARFPHEYKTWLWEGHTIPNGDPAEPFAPGTGLSSIMLAPPMTVSKDFWTLPVSADKTIHFFALLPLHPDELNLKLKKGSDELLTHFERAKFTELLNPTRPSCLTKPWWKIF